MTEEPRDQADETASGEEDVDAHLLKESVGAGLAAAAIFAGSAQAKPMPDPPTTGETPATLQQVAETTQGVNSSLREQPSRAQKAKAAKSGKKAKATKAAAPASPHRPGGGPQVEGL